MHSNVVLAPVFAMYNCSDGTFRNLGKLGDNHGGHIGYHQAWPETDGPKKQIIRIFSNMTYSNWWFVSLSKVVMFSKMQFCAFRCLPQFRGAVSEWINNGDHIPDLQTKINASWQAWNRSYDSLHIETFLFFDTDTFFSCFVFLLGGRKVQIASSSV